MLKIGLEKELFILHDDRPVVVPDGLPFDDSGLLVEVRSEPFKSPTDAIFNLKGELYKINKKVGNEFVPLHLSDIPFIKITPSIKLAARRKFTKGLNKYQNLYGYEFHKTPQNSHTAGMHVSFTNPQSYSVYRGGNTYEEFYNSTFDWVQIFRKLDGDFKEEISAAKRRPGFYEIKADGRVEYRSLPSNVDLDKLADILEEVVHAWNNNSY